MFPRWQVLCNRTDLHIMASKTLWKQMSGKLFTLIQILQGEGVQNIFLKHGLALVEQRLGWTARSICSPILPLHLCGWESFGTSSPAGHSKGNPRQGWVCCWHPGEQAQGAEPGQEGAAWWDTALTSGVSPWASPRCSGSSSTNPAHTKTHLEYLTLHIT